MVMFSLSNLMYFKPPIYLFFNFAKKTFHQRNSLSCPISNAFSFQTSPKHFYYLSNLPDEVLYIFIQTTKGSFINQLFRLVSGNIQKAKICCYIHI